MEAKINVIYGCYAHIELQECLGLGSAIVLNVTELDNFLNKFNVVLPVHGLKPDFESPVSINNK